MTSGEQLIAWLLFWGSALLLLYTYLGYPALMLLAARFLARPVRGGKTCADKVSVLLAVRDGVELLPRKLESILAQTLTPREVIVVGDGVDLSADPSLAQYAARGVRLLNQPPQGKWAALNRAIEAAQADILVFTDVRQPLEPHAIERLVEPLGDPGVGCAAGALVINPSGGEHGAADTLRTYWSLESRLRRAEGRLNSIVGASGALYAVRARLAERFPAGLVLDDVYLPMRIVLGGHRTVEASQALCFDSAAQPLAEFRRKVRTLCGNYQLLRVMPELLSFRDPILFQFISHKLLRLFSPLMLMVMLVTSGLLPGALYRLAFALQLAAYLLGAAALLPGAVAAAGRLRAPAETAAAFVLLHAAAVVAMVKTASQREIEW